jgi:hypothetical protein
MGYDEKGEPIYSLTITVGRSRAFVAGALALLLGARSRNDQCIQKFAEAARKRVL